jgi:hypothetical protein
MREIRTWPLPSSSLPVYGRQPFSAVSFDSVVHCNTEISVRVNQKTMRWTGYIVRMGISEMNTRF